MAAFGGGGNYVVIPDEEFIDRQRRFQEFFDSSSTYGDRQEYKEIIRNAIKSMKKRVIVNLNDLRQYNREMADQLLTHPLEWIPPMEAAIMDVIINLQGDSDVMGGKTAQTIHVGLEGSFGELYTTPRFLSARHLGHLVCLDGIVTSCSLVRPKMLRSVHYNETRRQFVMREYYDATMIGAPVISTSTSYPVGADGERLVSEFGLSQYRDYQTISMQEMPEKAPAGQLPRSVDIVLDDDLVDQVKPGDRIQIIGVYKSLATAASNGIVPASFRAVLIANNIRMLGRESTGIAPNLSSDDLYNIRAISRRGDVFDLLAHSLAPSIYGHEWIKRAVLLMLLGGVERNLEGGGHIRGDINLLLVGDPSTAKSQMLRFVLGLAPLAIATTGRGSSGVGLTAAVTVDKETGERRLEAGAMVLADRGIICIDEFDKMSDMDRVAIHEVMEQQTVTIAKAGIHASLNARCSVLAAANPIWGQYVETKPPKDNINLPDSLLSRFDLLFIVLDRTIPEQDRLLSSHVLRMHRYLPHGVVEGMPIAETNIHDLDEDEAEEAEAEQQVFQKHYAQSRANKSDNCEEESGDDEEDNEILTLNFVKKYIFYAKSRLSPVLTKAASESIITAYADFRQKREQGKAGSNHEARTFPVTPRTLETLIRLATAHAKARLSPRVERRDAKVAQEMVEYCLYQEVKKKPSKRRCKRSELQADSDDPEDYEEEEEGDKEKHGNEGSKNDDYAQNEIKAADKRIGKHKAMDNNATLVREIEPALKNLQIEAQPVESEGIESVLASSLPQAGNMVDSQFDSLEPSNHNEPFISQNTLTPSYQATIPPAWETAVKTSLHLLRRKQGDNALTIQGLRQELQRVDSAIDSTMTDEQIEQVLLEMQQMNQLMYSEGMIYLI